mgnify:CR=1 FL=1
MKKHLITGLFAALALSASAQSFKEWLDPEVNAVNRAPMHTNYFAYESADVATRGLKEQSSRFMTLNGIWKFFWVKDADARPTDFWRVGYNDKGWNDIPVPGVWELNGFGDPIYVNIGYAWRNQFQNNPPQVPVENNHVGSYRREITVPADWKNKDIIAHFGSVTSNMYLWVNGRYVGYSEDSKLEAEFDLTPYLKPGQKNLIAFQVFRWCDGSYLEDQDFFRFFGIFRDVNLYGIPAVHVEDLWIRPKYHPEDGKAELELDIRLSQKKKENNIQGKIKVSLQDIYSDENHVLLDETENLNNPVIQKNLPVEGSVNNEIQFRYELEESVHAWSNEDPYLYELLIEVQNEKGETVEVVPYQIGFRKIELKGRKMLLNGKRLIINGVNRHEWNARSGRCITETDEKWDIECIRRNHINAVRTCHYPDHISWYYRCDQAGIYLMAETNLETHGSWLKQGVIEPSWNVPGSIGCWRGCTLDRAVSNFESFKNHVSVLFWSLGNESYAGDILVEMNRYYKEKDPDRLVHYEGVAENRPYEDLISDMESQMYASPEKIKEYLENNPKKPFILCEYMHDMGNSLGGMESYIRLLDQYEDYQGGFIWDYIDQALFVKDEVTGRDVLRYGGDFDDRPSDYEFSGNGILFADRTEKPAMQEVRHYYGLRR